MGIVDVDRRDKSHIIRPEASKKFLFLLLQNILML